MESLDLVNDNALLRMPREVIDDMTKLVQVTN